MMMPNTYTFWRDDMLTQGNLMLWAYVWALTIIAVMLLWKRKFPSAQSFNELASSVNSRGGNIIVLTGLSLVFFFTGMKMFYWVLDRIIENKLTPDNAIVITGVNWVTGAAFGMAFSSMLKAMTGENSKARTSDSSPSNSPTTTNTPPPPKDAPQPTATQGNTGVQSDLTTLNPPVDMIPPTVNG